MSDLFRCEVCSDKGKRYKGKLVPEGWYYAEVTDDDHPSNPIVVGVCSTACRSRFWKSGPGHLNLTEERCGPPDYECPLGGHCDHITRDTPCCYCGCVYRRTRSQEFWLWLTPIVEACTRQIRALCMSLDQFCRTHSRAEE